MTLTALDIVRFDLNPKVICWIADYKCISANFKHHNAVDLVLRLSFNNLTPTLKKQQIQFKNNNNRKTNGYNFKKFKQNTSHEWQWNCDELWLLPDCQRCSMWQRVWGHLSPHRSNWPTLPPSLSAQSPSLHPWSGVHLGTDIQ